MKVQKVVIPIAGLGTRFLPATKTVPKDMLSLLDRPLIHYVVDEAARSGASGIIFVASHGSPMALSYLRRDEQLEQDLANKGKTKILERMRGGDFHYDLDIEVVVQERPLGLGHAILQAKDSVGPHPFGVILPDDLIFPSNLGLAQDSGQAHWTPCLGQLTQFAKEEGIENLVAVMEVARERVSDYGVVVAHLDQSSKASQDSRVMRIEGMVEKPAQDKAPSTLAAPGRYLFSPKIFEKLEQIQPGPGGEYQLTDAIDLLSKESEVYSFHFEGARYDSGQLPGHFEATVDLALSRQDMRQHAIKVIKERYQRLKKEGECS